MNDLVSRNSFDGLRRVADRSAASSADTVFNTPYRFSWEGLPGHIISLVPDVDAPIAACDIKESSKVRTNRTTGQFWQPATIWRATRSGISQLDVRQVLRKTVDGKYARTGKLDLERALYFPATQTPNRRAGVVEQTAGEGPDGASSTGKEPEETLDYLPGPVQAEARALVPTPDFVADTFIQSSRNGLAVEQRIVLLRMSSTVAVVIAASRKAPSAPLYCTPEEAQRRVAERPWEVTRYSYQLSPARQLGYTNAEGDRPQVSGQSDPTELPWI